MKVASRSDVAVSIPSHSVSRTLGDGQIAVRTNPGLAIIRIGTRSSLHDVFDAIFDNGSLDTDPNHVEVEFVALVAVLA